MTRAARVRLALWAVAQGRRSAAGPGLEPAAPAPAAAGGGRQRAPGPQARGEPGRGPRTGAAPRAESAATPPLLSGHAAETGGERGKEEG